MAKRAVPGLYASKGVVNDFPVYPDGKYAMKIEQHTEKESKSGLGLNHTFRLRCVEAFDDAKENIAMVDKVYFHRMHEMYEEHNSFEEFGHIFVDELKSMCLAAGVKISKNDGIDYDDFIDKTVVVTFKTKKDQDDEGNDVKVNVIRKWEADETEE